MTLLNLSHQDLPLLTPLKQLSLRSLLISLWPNLRAYTLYSSFLTLLLILIWSIILTFSKSCPPLIFVTPTSPGSPPTLCVFLHYLFLRVLLPFPPLPDSTTRLHPWLALANTAAATIFTLMAHKFIFSFLTFFAQSNPIFQSVSLVSPDVSP